MNNSFQTPVVIGGLGGSGTRVVARVVRRAGYFLGANVTGAEDSVEFWEFYDRWINRYLLRGEAPLSSQEKSLMERDWSACAARHRLLIPSQAALWGWKNPRSILLLNFLHERYPEMKFIQVVRDGRDMAFSATAQAQVRQHGANILGRNLFDTSMPAETSACWAKINLEAAAYGELHMGKQYLVVRFEDLCAEPQASVERIFTFLEREMNGAAQIANEFIRTPGSLGRWRKCTDRDLLREIQRHAQDALQKFGYCKMASMTNVIS